MLPAGLHRLGCLPTLEHKSALYDTDKTTISFLQHTLITFLITITITMDKKKIKIPFPVEVHFWNTSSPWAEYSDHFVRPAGQP